MLLVNVKQRRERRGTQNSDIFNLSLLIHYQNYYVICFTQQKRKETCLLI